MQVEELKNYDFGLAVDSSGSMSNKLPNGKSRWDAAREGTFAVANKIAEFDSDGIDVYRFASGVKAYRGVTPDKVDQIWQENSPMGSTALHKAIQEARKVWQETKAKGTTKKGYILTVVTDGIPDDADAVAREIIDLANSLENDGEFGIQLLQVGDDASARDYLKSLDDDLTKRGAKYDIVDTTTFEEAENKPLTELLIGALLD